MESSYLSVMTPVGNLGQSSDDTFKGDVLKPLKENRIVPLVSHLNNLLQGQTAFVARDLLQILRVLIYRLNAAFSRAKSFS